MVLLMYYTFLTDFSVGPAKECQGVCGGPTFSFTTLPDLLLTNKNAEEKTIFIIFVGRRGSLEKFITYFSFCCPHRAVSYFCVDISTVVICLLGVPRPHSVLRKKARPHCLVSANRTLYIRRVR